MVTLSTADKALKSYYLGVAADQINLKASPLLAEIKKTSKDVWGKEVVKLAPYGVNGGISAGTEDGALPSSRGKNHVQLVQSLKNLYGKLEISDKAVRASSNNAGAFVNLLNDEMESLINSAASNLSRMLFGDGSGTLATVDSVSNGVVTMDSVRNLIEGQVVDFCNANGVLSTAKGLVVKVVDYDDNTVVFEGTLPNAVIKDTFCVIQGSLNNEITGLGKILDSANSGTIYGLTRANYGFLNPIVDATTTAWTETTVQTMIDKIEMYSGTRPNFLLCSAGVRRYYQNLLTSSRRNIDFMELKGGYKTISYCGIPLVADRFCAESTLYLLNTADFAMHQLCDWQWLEAEDGSVLRQIADKACYQATLVKYAELMCDRIRGQGVFTALTEA